jgi:hypothetical protein
MAPSNASVEFSRLSTAWLGARGRRFTFPYATIRGAAVGLVTAHRAVLRARCGRGASLSKRAPAPSAVGSVVIGSVPPWRRRVTRGVATDARALTRPPECRACRLAVPRRASRSAQGGPVAGYCDGAVSGPTATPFLLAEGLAPSGAKSMQARPVVQCADVSLAGSACEPSRSRYRHP